MTPTKEQFAQLMRAVTEPRYCAKCGAPGVRDFDGVQYDICASHLYAPVKVVDIEREEDPEPRHEYGCRCPDCRDEEAAARYPEEF